jgi:phosphate transport system substrate-binding protein
MKKLIKRSKTFLLFIIVITVFFCNSCKNTPKKNGEDISGKVAISGAFALYPLTVRWAEEFKKENPNVTIDISAGGAGKGMTDALSGMVDLGMFSREISPEEVKKGAWGVSVVKDAVIPTINANSPLLNELKQKGIKPEHFKEIFIDGTIKTWNEIIHTNTKNSINVFTRADACGAAAMWAKYLGYEQEDLLGTGVFGDPGMADAIRNDKFSLGYNNVIYVYDLKTKKKYEGLEVVPIDLNSNGEIDEDEDFYEDLEQIMKAIKNNRYPSPPARPLYFVSNGTPKNPVAIEFLKWILTKGQSFVGEAGCVHLSDSIIAEEFKKLSVSDSMKIN